MLKETEKINVLKESAYEDMIYKLEQFVKKNQESDDDVKAFFRALDKQDFDHNNLEQIRYAASDALDKAGLTFNYDELSRLFYKGPRESKDNLEKSS